MPGRNLAEDPPVFSDTWIKRMKTEYNLKATVSKPIDQVSFFFNTKYI
jgi:hypothetical protein